VATVNTQTLVSAIWPLVALGRRQEAIEHVAEAEQLQASPFARNGLLGVVPILCAQGKVGAARGMLNAMAWARNAEQPDVMAGFALAEARVLRAEGRAADALAAAERGLAPRNEQAITGTSIRSCLIQAVEAALDLDDVDKAEALVARIETLRQGDAVPSFRANRARLRARLDARRGRHSEVDDNVRRAGALFDELGFAFAVCQLEHAEWLTSQGPAGEAERLLAQARETFEQLEAKPWLERLAADETETPDEVPASASAAHAPTHPVYSLLEALTE
jgi:hypothetical protein